MQKQPFIQGRVRLHARHARPCMPRRRQFHLAAEVCGSGQVQFHKAKRPLTAGKQTPAQGRRGFAE